jgi:hypothetical protein
VSIWNSLSRKNVSDIPDLPDGSKATDWALLLSSALNLRFMYPASHDVIIHAPTQEDPTPTAECQHSSDPKSAPILFVAKTPLVRRMKEHEFAAYVKDMSNSEEEHIPVVEPQRRIVGGFLAYLWIYDIYYGETATTVRTIAVAVLTKASVYYLAVSAPDYLQVAAQTVVGIAMGSFEVGKE